MYILKVLMWGLSLDISEILCVCDIFFIILSVDGHLGCFQDLAIVNNAETNMRLQMSLLNTDFKPLWPHLPITPALRNLRQEDYAFKTQPGLQSKSITSNTKPKLTNQTKEPSFHLLWIHTQRYVWLLDHVMGLFLIFWGTSILFSQWLCQNHIPEFSFFYILISICYVLTIQ